MQSKHLVIAIFLGVMINALQAQVTISRVGYGWAVNSVNTVVFRKNSVVSFGNQQYIAFYDSTGTVVIGKRKLPGGNWKLNRTPYKGKVTDAHNSISIMVDGDGYLHIAWDHHGHPLRYCKSVAPGSLVLTEKLAMTGKQENKITYPEFYKLSNGNLLFLYRDGSSGNGNLVINRYNRKTKQWTQVQDNLIDGEGQRNAYWQAAVDQKGSIHLSWVWRESPDVASNHDICYARSDDEGNTWKRSDNSSYMLPIKAATAEYIVHIPQGSELINQSSMCVNDEGIPMIASYWKNKTDSVPQYQVLFFHNSQWQHLAGKFRKTNFSLSGGGTKQIPIARPQVVSWKQHSQWMVGIIYRDKERNSKVSFAYTPLYEGNWRLMDLNKEDLDAWEPTYDTELWQQKKLLHLFIQRTEQKDGEGKGELKPQPVSILQWKPGNN